MGTFSITRPLMAALVAIWAIGLHGAPAQAQTQTQTLPAHVVEAFGTPPAIPEGPLSPALDRALRIAFVDIFETRRWDTARQEALEQIVQARDPRVAWVITDMMRFTSGSGIDADLAAAATRLLDVRLRTDLHWNELTDHLIAWDMPSFPGYLEFKRAIFTSIVPGWEALFVEGDIDWRLVSWGGVLIDDRPFERTEQPCRCIPAIDNPAVVSAAAATWPADDAIVFGIAINGEYRAYPRQIMEVREMVNDTLGGRDLAIPYCTLCGAAQAWFTDGLSQGVDRPVMRTSGLLIRSNKVMYDVVTKSVFDTFLGHAVTGPLAGIGLQLEQATVITTDWGTWRRTYPQTTVLIEALALGRNPDFRNGRDADGPIFPVGDVDPRLPVHEDVIGVIAPSGAPWAFSRVAAMAALLAGAEVTAGGVRLTLDAGGLRATGSDGADLGSHEAFWFAWSQFHPGTELWNG